MKLKKDKIICSKCKGEGIFNQEIETIDYYYRGNRIKASRFSKLDICKKCQGNGKLDWIEVIVGKKEHDIWFIPESYGKGLIPEIKFNKVYNNK